MLIQDCLLRPHAMLSSGQSNTRRLILNIWTIRLLGWLLVWKVCKYATEYVRMTLSVFFF
jgi:hypothetical protein